MSLSFIRCPQIVIANATDTSDPVIGNLVHADAEQVQIFTPSGAAETFSVETSPDFDENYLANGMTLSEAIAAATWYTNDATLGAAGAMVVLDSAALGGVAWRLKASVAVAAERTFELVKHAHLSSSY